MNDIQAPDIAEHVSPLTFDATIERLVQAIADRGMTIFARIDHAVNARNAGMNMPPAMVLIYGDVKTGMPLMLATPLSALDLPLRVLVQERGDGKATVAFHPIAATLRRAGVVEDDAARVDELLVAALGLELPA